MNLRLTWGELRRYIAARGPYRTCGVVFCQEGTFCARCGGPTQIVYDVCPACRGGAMPLEMVTTRRKKTP